MNHPRLCPWNSTELLSSRQIKAKHNFKKFNQIEKKLLELGKKTFEILSAGGIRAVDKSDSDVNSLVVEIDSLYAKKEEKEVLLTNSKDAKEENGDSPENSGNPGD